MGKFAFENFPGEPSSMRAFHDVHDLGVRGIVNAVPDAVPMQLQTEDYMTATLALQSGTALVGQRRANRVARRDLLEGVPQIVLLTSSGLERDVAGNKDLQLAQIDHVLGVLGSLAAIGYKSWLDVRIVPHDREPKLFEGGRSAIGLSVGRIVTNEGVYIYADDGKEVDDLDAEGLRGDEARRRDDLLTDVWMPNSVERAAALDVVQQIYDTASGAR